MNLVKGDNSLSAHYIHPKGTVHHNLSINDLVKKALENKEVLESKSGAIVVYTGKYTGRSPKDKFIVDTARTHDHIDWGKINQPMAQQTFDKLYKKIGKYLSEKEEMYVFDGFIGADKKHTFPVRIVSEYAYQSLFMRHLLIRPTEGELKNHSPQITVICAPGCTANPKEDNTNSEVFIAADLEKRIVLIGGTKYAGEMKKAVFTLMNYLLPEKGVFPMHASVNVGKKGDSTLFFGLSGTGKTTLSADPKRLLIGDDEHGWTENGVFNFEGGCYAKCINLKKESEPLIWNAIKHGTLIENVVLQNNGEFDFTDKTHTENTRAAYPIDYIENAVATGVAGNPKVVIFLTADAFGVLPPVAKLSLNAAMYHFLSGYTSKLAGTERGITEPVATFSTYFGAPFMPRHPKVYAELLKKYVEKNNSTVFLVNTGWTGGPYGVGQRISIEATRCIVDAIIAGKLNDTHYYHDNMFNLDVPKEIPGVDSKILYPRNLWKDKGAFDAQAKKLVTLFVENFKKFSDIPKEVLVSGPKLQK